MMSAFPLYQALHEYMQDGALDHASGLKIKDKHNLVLP